MAIVDSIALGKSKGSVGNVTFYQLGGQTIARSRNLTPYDPKTPAQLNQRLGVQNVVKSFKLMKLWAKGFNSRKTGKKTYYNVFTSLMIDVFPRVVFTSYLDVLKYPTKYQTGFGNTFYPAQIVFQDNIIRMWLGIGTSPFYRGMMANLGIVNLTDDSFDFEEKEITLQDYYNGYIDFEKTVDASYISYSYIYNLAYHLQSEVIITPIFIPYTVQGILNVLFTGEGDNYPCIPPFTPDNDGWYDVNIDLPEITLTFDWLHPDYEHYIIYQDSTIDIVTPNNYVLPIDRVTSELVIAIYPPNQDVTEYKFRLNQA